MYLRRKLDEFLDGWRRTEGRQPLVIRGARQVGKTETILNFGRRTYRSLVVINFAESPQYRTIVERGFSAESIVKMITLLDASHVFVPHETLLFFDEVQEFPEIATCLKFFCLDGRYDVICSGSMLGGQYHRVSSFSVGYKQDLEMRSMDFEEFLWAHGYGDELTAMMLAHMRELTAFQEGEFRRLLELFLDYAVVGGMPRVVADLVTNGHFGNTLTLQRQLLYDYGVDIRKYAEGLDQGKVKAVFESVPMQLAKEYKRFQYTQVSPRARARDYFGCVEWLCDAGLVTLCRCLNFPELPLKGNSDESRFKLYFADTGLLVASLDDDAQQDLRRNRNLGVYKGALYENLAAEALSKSGCGLYYYRREDSRLEEDFFIRDARGLYPIEVKAGNNRSKSLRTLIESDRYPDVHGGFKLALANIGKVDAITTFPLFCAFLLKRHMQERS